MAEFLQGKDLTFGKTIDYLRLQQIKREKRLVGFILFLITILAVGTIFGLLIWKFKNNGTISSAVCFVSAGDLITQVEKK